MKQLLIVISLLFSCISMSWGQNGFMVAGTVMDENGEPLIGVSVVNQANTSQGTVTDLDGKFRLPNLLNKTTLLFTYVGFKNEKYVVTGNKEQIKIVMKADVSDLDEVVVVGQANQRKVSVTGAITVVKPEILDQPGTSISNMLGGNVPGIIAVTRSGEPGDDFSEFWIRGISTFGANASALVLVDGVEGNINDLDPSDIESFSVLKDASATAVYGVRGANGVVVITTKSGKAGKLRINFKTNLIMSESARMPEYADAYSYAQLANEARLSRGKDPIYSDVAMELIRTGMDQDLYPNVNWRDVILKDHVWQNQHFLSVAGGGTAARYYMSLSIQNKDAVFKQDKSANKYDTNVSYHKYSFLANMDVNLTKTTNLGLKLNQVIVNQNAPGFGDNNDALWQAQANLTPLTTPVKYSDGSLATYGANADELSPYVQLNYTGFKENRRLNTGLLVTLKQDLSFITKGLDIKGVFSYNGESQHNITRTKMPDLYYADGRNADGSLNLKRTREKKDLSFGKDVYSARSYYWELTGNYNRTFGEHRIGGLVLFYLQSNSNSDANDNLAAIPTRYESLSGRVTYGFKDTYFAEFNMGYNGSENFAKGHRFGFFPAYAVGWMISNEKFWEPILPVVSELKLKASYGSVGNDAIGGDRWIYQSTISTNNGWNYGENGSEGGGGIQVGNVENLNVSWEKAYKTNLGFAMRLFDRIKIQADYFHEKREGVFINRQGLPAIVGLTTKPKTNIGASVNRGVDATLEYEEKVGEVFLTGRANFTFNRNKLLNNDEVEHLYKYQNSIGKTFGTGGNHTFGLIAEGLFQSQEEIDNAPEQNFGTYRVGDVRYRDVNGDGVVDTYDKVALGYTNIPEITYGFGLTAQWRSWDINAFFQGIAHCTFYIGGTAMRPFSTGNINQSPINADIYDHVWKTTNTPEQNLAAYYPRLSEAGGEGSTNNNQTSTLTMRDGRFLRLKNFEIGYTIPKSILEKTFIKSTRIYVSGSNLLTFSKFKLWDPETGSSDGGIYPPLRVFTIGLNAKF